MLHSTLPLFHSSVFLSTYVVHTHTHTVSLHSSLPYSKANTVLFIQCNAKHTIPYDSLVMRVKISDDCGAVAVATILKRQLFALSRVVIAFRTW